MAARRTMDTVLAKRRKQTLRLAGKNQTIDALLVTHPQDVSYLSGFTGDDSVLLVGDDWAALVTDGRYDEQAARECRGIEVVCRDGAMAAAIAEVLKPRKLGRLGFQSGHVTVLWRDGLVKALGSRPKLVGVRGVLAKVRATKDAQEIAAIRKSASVAQRAFRQLIAAGKSGFIGRTEGEIAAQLDFNMRKLGASGPSFETIVAAGPHGSLPHYRPGSTRIKPDQAVLIDWGALVDGYCSDLTRVVFTGRIPPKISEIYQVVLRAQVEAISAVRPGRTCKSVDQAARGVIEKAGYGEQFVHGLGHGIGRQIHEAPSVSRTSEDRLRVGMVVTVEPGIYLPGVGGVRIEDDVVVTADGQTKLTSLPKTLQSMVLR